MKNLQIRAEVYNLFSQIFTQPDKSQILENQIPEELCALYAELNTLIKSNEKCSIELTSDHILDDILLEYTRIFLGPFKVLVPPYGSYYLDEQKQLNQQSTVEVEKFYDKFELEISVEFKDLPDHIIPELEFMQYLIFNEGTPDTNSDFTIEDYRAAQKEFFMKLFYPFCKSVCNDIINTTTVKFYNSVSILLLQFLDMEYRRLKDY